MKVLSRSGSRFIVDPEDGHPQVLVVKVENQGASVKLFPRTSLLETVAARGGWVAPTRKQRRLVEDLLSQTTIPGPHKYEDSIQT